MKHAQIKQSIDNIHQNDNYEATNQPPFYGDVDSYYKRVFAEIHRKTQALSHIESDHYGSGFASFIDAWFYKDNESFQTPKESNNYDHSFEGLVVIFSRFEPYYCMFQGEKSWNDNGASCFRYMPYLDIVDSFDNDAVYELSQDVEKILTRLGLTRLSKSDLSISLEDYCIPTVLNSQKNSFTYFDGLFFWED